MPERTIRNEQIQKKSSKMLAFLIYAVFLYGFWTCKELLIEPAVTEILPEGALHEILFGLLKLAVWTVPALLLARRYSDEMQVGFREMFTSKPPLKIVLISFLVYTLVSFPLLKLFKGTLALNPDFHIGTHLWLLIVGITEEAVFRGWMLNATAKKTNDAAALGLNALMFLAIHFPKWIDEGIFVQAFTGFGFLSIIAFSVVTGYIFLKTKNLLLPVLLHMWYDLMLSIFA